MIPIAGVEVNTAMKRSLQGWSAGPRKDTAQPRGLLRVLLRRG